MPDLITYLSLIVLVMLSAYFSASEIAFAAANAMRLKNAAEEKKTLRARLALRIYNDYEKALATILIGNNLVNIGSSAIATVLFLNLLQGTRFADLSSWISTFVMTMIILIFGEIMPKNIAKKTADSFCGATSVPLFVLMIVTRPLVWITEGIVWLVSRLWSRNENSGPAVTEDELETIIETVEDEGVLDEDEAELVQSALDFDDVLAYEVITPRVDMVAIDVDDPPEEIMEVIETSPFSRIPVYEDTIDNIIGTLHLNQCLKTLVAGEELNVRKMLKPAYFVHKTMPLSDVLKGMRAQHKHLAVVTDEYGGVMGILTMEDVLEQIVGDIWDESDTIEDECKQLADNLYEVDGDMRILDFFDEIDMDDRDFDDDNITMGGWIVELLGHYPKTGDSAQYQNLRLTVRKIHKRRVRRILVKVYPVETEEEE